MKKLAISCIFVVTSFICIVFATMALATTPTFSEVSIQMAKGDVAIAQVMMDEILRKRPESAKAHTLNAELLALQHANPKLIEAELAKANQIITKPVASKVEQGTNGIIMGLLLITVAIICAMIFTYIRAILKDERGKWPKLHKVDKDNYRTTLTGHSNKGELK